MEAKSYIMKLKVVDAIRFDGYNINACRKLVGEKNKLTIDADSRISRSMILKTQNGSSLVQAGDWLVRDDKGGIDVQNDEYFTGKYEELVT